MKQSKSKKMPIDKNGMAGCFLLKNNELSSSSRNGLEKGILLNKRFYLDLDSLLRYPVTFETAMAFCEKLKHALPTGKQLDMLERHLETVNMQLLACDRGDCLVTGNLSREYWVRGEEAEGRRRMLFILPVTTL
ncbi:MAG: hypothetical protein J6N49_05035 [Alphaproteobacteria bacterium]|nr:hypothetical protein [Alphaproteobacteria bacterium]